MFIEPPATIAILGAGPIGLEATLYARYLGYDVKLFERGEVAQNVLDWGQVKMFSPFRMNASPLGLRALAAQDESYTPPGPDELLTGSQWYERYLLPLAQSDLVIDSLQTHSRVLALARTGVRKGELIRDPARADKPFRLLVEDASGQRDEFAEVVIDCTGSFGNHNWCGTGGASAIGETTCAREIEYGLPDFLGAAKSRFAGRRTLVIGSGYSAATNVVALAELLSNDAGQVTWITKAGDDEPVARIVDDRLEARDALAVQANGLAANGNVEHLPGVIVERIDFDEQQRTFSVHLKQNEEPAEARTFDNVVANVGYRPDGSLYDELQVHRCYATDGPMKLAAALLGEPTTDCLDQIAHGPQTLLTPEPNFYVLGSKSYGRNSNFLVSVGLAQIRDLFTIIGDREDLDLYATMNSSSP